MRFKLFLIFSALCYILAHIFPVYRVGIHEGECFQGIWMNLLGWLSLGSLFEGRIEFLVWCANPIYVLISVIVAINYNVEKDYCPSNLSFIGSCIATVCGLLYIWSRGIVVNEGGSMLHVESLLVGYWLWVIAFALLALALWDKRKSA